MCDFLDSFRAVQLLIFSHTGYPDSLASAFEDPSVSYRSIRRYQAIHTEIGG